MNIRSVRRTASILLGTALLLSLRPARAWAFEDAEVSAIVRHQLEPSQHAGVGGVWMARQTKITIDGRANADVVEHLLARVFDSDWAKWFRPYRIRYWNETQAIRVLRARIWTSPERVEDLPSDAIHVEVAGEVAAHPAFQSLKEVQINFPSVKPGQTLEILFERRDQVRRDEFNIRWFEHDFGDSFPVIEDQLIVRYPTALEPTVERVGARVPGRLRRGSGYREFTWITGNLPGLPVDLVDASVSRTAPPGAPAADSASAVVFTNAPWNYLSFYVGRLWKHHILQDDPTMTTKVSELAGREDDPEKRARVIEAFVQKKIETLPIPPEIRALRPLDSAATYAAAAGSPMDKTCLLVALLQKAGLRASPVMIRSRAGPWDSEVGCPAQLDRFLVRVTLSPEETIWCDPIESATPLPAGKAWIISQPEIEHDRGLLEFPGRP